MSVPGQTRHFDWVSVTSGLPATSDVALRRNNQRYVSISFMKIEWNSMRCFAFYGKGNPCAPVSPSARLPSDFTRTYGGCDHATGQASFEAETHNQSRRREGAGCRRTEFFAGG
jgi:hypothetical protein